MQGTARWLGAARRYVNAPGCDASVEDGAAQESTEIADGGALGMLLGEEELRSWRQVADAQCTRALETTSLAGAARCRVNVPGRESRMETTQRWRRPRSTMAVRGHAVGR